jgi:hypothetical protein
MQAANTGSRAAPNPRRPCAEAIFGSGAPGELVLLFAMHERTCTRSEGRQPRVVRGNAPARECDFCDARTHMHRSGERQPPRGSRKRTGKGVPLLRCTNAHASGAGGRQPPVARGTARAAAWRNCSGDIRPTHWRAPAQLRYHHTHGGLTPAALVPGESPSACGLRFPLPVRSFEPSSANTLLCTAEVAFFPRPNGVHQGRGFRPTAQASPRTLKSRSSASRWR